MPGPLLYMAGPLLLAALYLGLRRWTNVALGVVTALTLLLALVVATLPVDQPLAGGLVFNGTWTVFGRHFILEPIDRLGVGLTLTQCAVLFLVTRLGTAQVRFIPLSLAIVSCLTAAMLVHPFVFAAIFIELASGLAVLLLADEHHRVTRGAWRFFVFMTLGMMCVLLTGWLLTSIETSPDDTSLIAQATLMLGVGFAILLGVAPFHSWLPEVAESSPAVSAAFVFTVMRYPAAVLLLEFLVTYPWLNRNPTVYWALTLAGAAMVALGSLFLYSQRRLGRAMGYAMLIDIGAFTLATGLGTLAGLQAALAIQVFRGLALLLWAGGVAILRDATGGADDLESLRGVARKRPFAAAAVLLGLMSLLGFPLTAGFPARLALLQLLAQIHPTAALLLVGSLGAVGLVAARMLTALITPLDAAIESPAGLRGRWLAEGPFAVAVLGVGLVVVLVLGAFPQGLLTLVAQGAQSLVLP